MLENNNIIKKKNSSQEVQILTKEEKQKRLKEKRLILKQKKEEEKLKLRIFKEKNASEIAIREKRAKDKAQESINFREYVKKFYKGTDITAFWYHGLALKHLSRCNRCLYDLEKEVYLFHYEMWKKTSIGFKPVFKPQFKIKKSFNKDWISLKKFHTIIYNLGENKTLWKYCNKEATELEVEGTLDACEKKQRKDDLLATLRLKTKKTKYLTEDQSKKIAQQWHKPSKKSLYKFPYFWSKKEIILFAVKYLYQLHPYDRAALTLLWYFKKDIFRLRKLQEKKPKVIRRYIGLFCYKYGVSLNKLDFLTVARFTTWKLRKEHIKKMRSIKRGPGKAIQFIKKYIKSKWSDDDIIIFTFITGLTLSPMIWFLYNLSTLAWAGALYTSLLEDLFLMEYTWYDMDIQFKRLKMFDSLKDNENQ